MPQPNSICHFVCQSCLSPPLRQGAREVHGTSPISNTECVHHRTQPCQYPGGSPSCWSRAWQSEWGRREQAGAELNPGCKPLAPREGVRCPEDTQKGAPSPPPRHLPRCGPCSPSHSNPLQPQGETAGLKTALPSCSGPQGQTGGRQGGLGERAPQVRHQSASQTNRGPYIEPVPVQDLGWRTRLATKSLVLQPTRVNAKPKTTYLSLQRGQQPRTPHHSVMV